MSQHALRDIFHYFDALWRLDPLVQQHVPPCKDLLRHNARKLDDWPQLHCAGL